MKRPRDQRETGRKTQPPQCLRSHICGGGFHRFFHYQPELLKCAADAYLVVGLPLLSEIVGRAVGQFPKPLDSEDDRLCQLDSLDEITTSALDDLFGEYCRTKNEANSIDDGIAAL